MFLAESIKSSGFCPDHPASATVSAPNLTQALLLELEKADPPAAGLAAFDHLRETLRCATARTGFAASTSTDYDATLNAAIAAAPTEATGLACRSLAHARAVLPWAYHYAERAGAENLASRIAFAELIGPDGPMAAPNARVGFTLIAPHTFYPIHAHPAVELYWVMSGNAEWITAGSKHVAPPGRFVLHRSNEPHAMRTFDQPLLALWGWSGDTDTPAYYL